MFKFYCKGYMLKYLTTLNRNRHIPIKSIFLKIPSLYLASIQLFKYAKIQEHEFSEKQKIA